MTYFISKPGSDTRHSMPRLKRLVSRSSMARSLGARSEAKAIFLPSRMKLSTSWKKNSTEACLPTMFWTSSMMRMSASRYSRMMRLPGPRCVPSSFM